MTQSRVPEIVTISEVEPEQLYDFQQRLVFSPARRGEGFLKFAVTTGRAGAKSVAHAHPRDEIAMTLRGHAILRIGEETYDMVPGTAVRIPPGVEHSVEVISDDWEVAAVYCDECQLCRSDIGHAALGPGLKPGG